MLAVVCVTFDNVFLYLKMTESGLNEAALVHGLSVEAAGDRNACVTEHMGDLRVTEARGVVFERELALGIVELEAAKAVGIGEFA